MPSLRDSWYVVEEHDSASASVFYKREIQSLQHRNQLLFGNGCDIRYFKELADNP